jgi:hypothetical protein
MKDKLHYIFLSSTDSKDINVNNTWYDFTVEFTGLLNLSGVWELALAEIQLNGHVEEHLDIYCDLCEYSYVGGKPYPILRRINYEINEFANLYFMRISNREINRIRIYIRDKNQDIPSVSILDCNCTLVFKKL